MEMTAHFAYKQLPLILQIPQSQNYFQFDP